MGLTSLSCCGALGVERPLAGRWPVRREGGREGGMDGRRGGGREAHTDYTKQK